MKINNFLKFYREKLGITQEKIAELSGITTRSYQRIEKGTQEPKITVALQIAQALQTTVEELFPLSQTPLGEDKSSKN